MSEVMVTIDDVLRAERRIAGHAVCTPLLSAPMLDQALGAEVFVKAETLQLTGVFKLRGALNKVMSLAPEALRRGVVAYSSGNHGIGVAAAARMAGTRAVIVLPTTAAATKVESCRWWGAEIVTYDPAHQRREEVAQPYMDQGLTLVPPFDDPEIVAGQATAGLEICRQLLVRGVRPDVVVIPCSGGGLSAGVVLAMRHFFPDLDCVLAEPAGYNKMGRSLAAGSRQMNAEEARTLLDALIGRIPGEIPYSILARHGVRAVEVSDDDALAAMALAFRTLRLVIEPSGAAGLAALNSGQVAVRGKRAVVLASGGNVDPSVFARALAL